MYKFLIVLVSFFVVKEGYAQKNKVVVNTNSADSTLLKDVSFRLIGPFRGGRSGAVAGSVKNKNTFYFGATGGGVWKTIDGGNNWKNISDKYFGGSIGAIAVAPSDETILYAGEGENTMRGNVSEGLAGIWRSDDAGRSWRNLGLKDGRHITNIIVHPKDPDIVWAGVMGHLFGPNKERGIYKTMDGGKTWKQVLFINDQTGISDLVMDPGNPQTLYAGSWRVIRTPYSLESGGEGSGLWKSTDGGETWKNISAGKGLPKGTWGIVGVAVAGSNTDKVYALVENEKGGLFVSNDAGESWTLQSSDNNIRQRAWYYTKVFVDPFNENLVYCPNVEFMVSKDGGKSFTSIRTPHGDHHDLWIDPEDGKRMIVADDGGAQTSFDAGANWSTYHNQPTVQVYRISTDNAFPYHVLGGQQDNSAFRIKSRSTGSAITASDLEVAAGAESGYVVADPLNPDITYGGNYMGTLMRLDHKTGEYRMINVWPVDNIGAGADAAKYRFQWNYPIFFSPHNPKRLYAAGNHLFVSENEGRSWEIISPDLTTNDKSKQASSGGPITKDNTSVEYYCTIFTAAESSIEKDLLWTGSDDGLVHVSRDGGKNWENVTPAGCPKWMMWNCVETDPFKKGAAYIVGTRYKLDDFTPYMYKTEDYGKTWQRIDNGINRMHFTRCLRADKKVPGLLYCGTEYGLYISYNYGSSWQPFQLNLPIVPVTDLTIKNNDLIVGTQGRSIYILDDLGIIQQQSKLQKDRLYVFAPAPAYRMEAGYNFGAPQSAGNAGTNAIKGIVIPYWLPAVNDSSKVFATIYDSSHQLVMADSSTAKYSKWSPEKVLNRYIWNFEYPEGEKPLDGLVLWNRSRMAPMAMPGNYYAVIRTGRDSAEVPFTVLPDPNYKVTAEEYRQQQEFLLAARDKFSETMKALKNINEIRKQMNEYSGRLADSLPKEVKAEMDSINKKMTSVEESLHQTKAKSGQDVLNYPIKLDDKLSSVYSIAGQGYGAPAKQVTEAYTDVAGQIDEQLKKLNNVISQDLPKLNAMIREKNLPVISVKK
jgi:photosystem II stability/assembly factor-like uncharacterized protein